MLYYIRLPLFTCAICIRILLCTCTNIFTTRPYLPLPIQEYRSLMANMSHDLKTPLAGATNGLEYLEGLLRCAPEVGDREAGKALRVDLLAG